MSNGNKGDGNGDGDGKGDDVGDGDGDLGPLTQGRRGGSGGAT